MSMKQESNEINRLEWVMHGKGCASIEQVVCIRSFWPVAYKMRCGKPRFRVIR